MTFPHLPQITSAVALALFVAAGSHAQSAAEIAGCPAFPADNILNTPVDDLPVHARSDAYIASIGAAATLHADFGSGLYEGGTIGIPWTSVPGTQPKVPVSFLYDDESEPGPYPIPPDAPVEGGSDDHVLVVERDGCVLYEVFDAERQGNGSWRGGSGAVFDLRSNRLRPDTWTSADAAGLPIAPLLVRYEEVAAGEIRHAIRFTADRSQRAYVWPGRHFASDTTDPNVPPMAQRFRLKAGFDVTRFSPPVRVILTAMKKHGLILADNGSDWYINGAPDEHWDNDVLRELRQVRGSDFEAVDVSSLMSDPNSGQARARGAAAAAVVHAASLQAGPVSPGLIVSIFGSGLGTEQQTARGCSSTRQGASRPHLPARACCSAVMPRR